MELHGTMLSNLRYAIASATRLRGKQVHADTLDYWKALLVSARKERSDAIGGVDRMFDQLIEKLSRALVERHPG